MQMIGIDPRRGLLALACATLFTVPVVQALAASQVPDKGRGANIVFIPTSVVLEQAEAAVEGAGYPRRDSKVQTFFDLLPAHGEPMYPGYVTFGYYRNSDPIYTLSMNEKTGQLLDVDRCMLFDYPKNHRFQVEMTRLSGIPPIPLATLAQTFGCDRIRRLRKRDV